MLQVSIIIIIIIIIKKAACVERREEYPDGLKALEVTASFLCRTEALFTANQHEGLFV